MTPIIIAFAAALAGPLLVGGVWWLAGRHANGFVRAERVAKKPSEVSRDQDRRAHIGDAGDHLPSLQEEKGDRPANTPRVEEVGESVALHQKLPSAVKAFHRELMRVQYMFGVLATLGARVCDEATEIPAIARRGVDLLTRMTNESTTEGRS